MTQTTASKPTRWIRPVAALLLWCGCLAAAFLLVRSALQQPIPRLHPAARRTPNAPSPAHRSDNPVGPILPTGATVLKDEPAGLPRPTGATRLLAYRTDESDACMETAVYRLDDTDPNALADWYHQLIVARGFHVLADRPPAMPINRIYTRSGRRLLIRIARHDQSLRVVVQLRYTKRSSP